MTYITNYMNIITNYIGIGGHKFLEAILKERIFFLPMSPNSHQLISFWDENLSQWDSHFLRNL